jgi:membrane protease YdiL (CAAX protease family)
LEIARPRLLRWLVGTFLILISWLIIGSILTGVTAAKFNLDLEVLASNDAQTRQTLASYQPWQAATTILVSFIPLFLATLLLYRYLLRLPLRALFSRSERRLLSEIRVGALTMGIILIVTGVPDMLANSESYKLNFNLEKFLPYLLIAVTLIPIQTSAEEVFFRGWIQQRLENGRRSIWLVSILGGALFALPHLANPEVNGELIYALLGYGATGFMFAWVSFRDRSIGISLGAHAINNIMAALVVTSEDSALPSVSVWTTPAVAWLPAAVVSVATIPFFIWLSARLNRKAQGAL